MLYDEVSVNNTQALEPVPILADPEPSTVLLCRSPARAFARAQSRDARDSQA